MPDDPKNNQQRKIKNERRPRRVRNQPTVPEKKPEESKVSRAPAPEKPEKPVYEEPPPEFFMNLKRETEEILKITEEANMKYKKKEIQSNWAKYEMPIESYQEIEEHENMGADYAKLIQTPLSIGGHFQFKHEKSWDLSMGPSLYDKYFDINMDNFMNALSCIPFYERNCIDKSVFNETDILTMNNRSTRFKQKYYNDKTFTTPELESQDKIVNALKENFNKNEEKENDDVFIKQKYDDQSSDPLVLESHEKIATALNEKLNKTEENEQIVDDSKAINTENKELIAPNKVQPDVAFNDKVGKKCRGDVHTNNPVVEETVAIKKVEPVPVLKDNKIEFKEDVHTNNPPVEETVTTKKVEPVPVIKNDKIEFEGNVHTNNPPVKETVAAKKVEPVPVFKDVKHTNNPPVEETVVTKGEPAPVFKVTETPKEIPVIENPEDLEKWLDEFLDG